MQPGDRVSPSTAFGRVIRSSPNHSSSTAKRVPEATRLELHDPAAKSLFHSIFELLTFDTVDEKTTVVAKHKVFAASVGLGEGDALWVQALE